MLDVPCPLSAEQLWWLRSEATFDEYNARLDKRTVAIERESCLTVDGKRKHTKELSSTLVDNPVPRAFRHVIDASLIAPNMTSEWFEGRWDEEHACTFKVDTAAFADKISISGRQWLTEDGSSRCIVSTRITIDCPVPGLGAVVERLVEDGMRKSYGSYEKRIPEYLKLHPSVSQSMPIVEACEQACQTEQPAPRKQRRVSWMPTLAQKTVHVRLVEEPSAPDEKPDIVEISPPCGLLSQACMVCFVSIARCICKYKRVNPETRCTEMQAVEMPQFDAHAARS